MDKSLETILGIVLMAVILIPAYMYDYNKLIERYTLWTDRHGGRIDARLYPVSESRILFPYRGVEIEIKMRIPGKGSPAYLNAILNAESRDLPEFSLSPINVIKEFLGIRSGDRIPSGDERFDARFQVFTPNPETVSRVFTEDIRKRLLTQTLNTTTIQSLPNELQMRTNFEPAHAWDKSEDRTYAEFIELLRDILDRAWT